MSVMVNRTIIFVYTIAPSDHGLLSIVPYVTWKLKTRYPARKARDKSSCDRHCMNSVASIGGFLSAA